MRKAVFAGSFDPFTAGHLDIVERGAKLFDELTVLVASNQSKKNRFDLSERIEIVKLSVQHLSNVRVDSTDGLTVEYMRTHDIQWMVRGVRNSKDLEWEQSVSFANYKLNPSCETMLLMAAPEHMFLSSSIVREMMHFGGDISSLVPKGALSFLKTRC